MLKEQDKYSWWIPDDLKIDGRFKNRATNKKPEKKKEGLLKCPSCNLVWECSYEHSLRRMKLRHYDCLSSYGLKRKICENCAR